MARSKKTQRESLLEEKCPQCGSSDFSVSEDISQKRYCGSCRNVWLPLSKAEIEVVHLEQEVIRLREENKELRTLLSKG